jgi:glutamyl-tRNA synthetase
VDVNLLDLSLPVGRLAPSPTGAQHVGNARTYLLAWLAARLRGGRVILRIEDIDSPRIKPGAAQQAVEDLRWLGLDWDEGPDVGGPHSPYVQTKRLTRYQAVFEELKRQERVYACTCTRSDVMAAASAPHVGQEGPIYPGTCAGRAVRDAERLNGQGYCWRFRASSGVDRFVDEVSGEQACDLQRELGDFVVMKLDGGPAYQLAVVVDDHDMGVTQVLRGDDLLPSAHRQRDLYAALRWPPPEFAHVPLVTGEDGRRLAKRHGDTRISVLRDHGVPSERLVGLLAWSCGLRETARPVAPSELLSGFSLGALPRGPFVLTVKHWAELLAE